MGRLVGRKIYGNPFEFDPSFKLFIDANHKPVIRGNDNAIWNRIRLVAFDVSTPKPEQDAELGEKLEAEASGILAWAVEGCLRWQQEGLGEPAAVSDARKQYREEMDVVADFIADCCTSDPKAQRHSLISTRPTCAGARA
jgi:putative DNA primase/helicase